MKVTEPKAVSSPSSARVSSDSGVVAKPAEAAPQDKVSVSADAKPPQVDTAQLRALQSAAAQSRAQNVQQVIAAVKSGQYYPSPQQIAQQLVSSAEVTAALQTLLNKG